MHGDTVQPKMFDESARRLRHQRAIAHVGRVEELRVILRSEINDLLANELGNVDRSAIHIHGAGESRRAWSSGQRESGRAGGDVETREPALVERAHAARIEPEVETRILKVKEHNPP